jgi:serine phosphatase RsbU (regulator of sigma subunit)
LHYRHQTRTVERLGMEQFPVGLIPAAEYRAATRYGSGDVFLMLTDGIVEVANASEEEFGLERVEQLLLDNSARPLAELAEVLLGGYTGTWAPKGRSNDPARPSERMNAGS